MYQLIAKWMNYFVVQIVVCGDIRFIVFDVNIYGLMLICCCCFNISCLFQALLINLLVFVLELVF